MPYIHGYIGHITQEHLCLPVYIVHCTHEPYSIRSAVEVHNLSCVRYVLGFVDGGVYTAGGIVRYHILLGCCYIAVVAVVGGALVLY